MNEVHLIGNVGNDPKVRASDRGTKFATFSLATSKKKYGTSGQNQEDWVTTWHNIKAVGKTAEFCEAEVRKGDEIYVRGEIEMVKFQDDGGKSREYHNIFAVTVRVTKPKEQQ